jgi:hypothetical protein
MGFSLKNIRHSSTTRVDNVDTGIKVDLGEYARCKKWITINHPLLIDHYFCESNATILPDSKTCDRPAEPGSEE